MKLRLILYFITGWMIYSCSSHLGKIGDQNYPSLEQVLTDNAYRLKEKLPDKTTLFVYVSDKKKNDSIVAEGTAFKIVEVGTPKISVLERKDLNKALEELERQSSDLYDQNTTVPLGKMVGAQYMVVPETNPVEKVYAKLYNQDMDKDIYYQKIDLKIKAVDLETGTIAWASKTFYWDISPNQDVEPQYRKHYFGNVDQPRYVFNNPQIIVVPNQSVIIRPVYNNQVKQSNQPQIINKPLIKPLMKVPKNQQDNIHKKQERQNRKKEKLMKVPKEARQIQKSNQPSGEKQEKPHKKKKKEK